MHLWWRVPPVNGLQAGRDTACSSLPPQLHKTRPPWPPPLAADTPPQQATAAHTHWEVRRSGEEAGRAGEGGTGERDGGVGSRSPSCDKLVLTQPDV